MSYQDLKSQDTTFLKRTTQDDDIYTLIYKMDDFDTKNFLKSLKIDGDYQNENYTNKI